MTVRRFALWAALPVAAFASTTATWEMSSYPDFIRGHFQGIALDRDGRLTLAPKLSAVFSSDQPVIWSVAQAPDGSIYAGTGHRGRIYRLAPDGQSALVWTAGQPEIFALALDPSGRLYAATSPSGMIFRIEGAQAIEVFDPKAKYIWSLAFDKSGNLFAGTGEPGNVYRIPAAGGGELYYETGQSHVTSLAVDPQGRLLAGSEPNGILYRIAAKDKAFVLYDANLPEIRSIVPMADGTIYVAAMGGSMASRTGQQGALPASLGSFTVTAPAASITVTDSSAQAGPEIKPKTDPSRQTPAIQAGTLLQAGPVVEVAGVDKSAIYRINLDSTVETLWTSKDENVYDLAAHSNGELYFATDAQGRIYRLNPDNKPALIVQAAEGEATRLIESRNGLLAATADMGKIFRLEDAPIPSGTYESPVHDSGAVARWGRIRWQAHGGAVGVQTRSGNSARPDRTWSDWSPLQTDPDRSAIASPNARYIQWRLQLSGERPAVESVTVAYLPQNSPPSVRSISVSTQAGSGAQKQTGAAASPASAAYSITVTDNGETASAAGAPSQTVSRGAGSQIQITWQADDPDGDRLAYSIYFRGEDETQWKLLRSNAFENSLLLDSDILADGRYYFRVVASDRPSNDRDSAREADLVSAPVLIDNTPPVVRFGTPTRDSSRFEVIVSAADETSPLRRCEYSLDAGFWQPVEALDGVTDSPQEQFRVVLDRLRAGEHLLVVRVYDVAGNAGLAKLVIR